MRLVLALAATAAEPAGETWWQQHNATVVFTVLAGVLAIAGGVIGALVSRRAAHTSWLKDRRLQAYADALAVSYSLWNDLAEEYGHGSPKNTTFLNFNQANAAWQKVMLLGPQPVTDAASTLDDAITDMYALMADPTRLAAAQAHHGYDVMAVPETVTWDAAEQAFIVAARTAVT